MPSYGSENNNNIKNVINKKRRFKVSYMPIIVIQVYLFLTIFLYHFWIVEWDIPKPFFMTLYVVINFLALGLGYVTYMLKKQNQLISKQFTRAELGALQGKKLTLFKISAWFNIIAALVYSYYYMGGISLNNIFSPGSAYLYRLTEFDGNRNILAQLFAYIWVLSYFYYPLGLLYWSSLKKRNKVLFILSTITTVIYWLNMGTMKGIGDLLILFIPVYLLKKHVYALTSSKRGFIMIKDDKRQTLALILIFSLFIGFFTIIGESRKSEIGIDTNEAVYITQAQMPFIKSIKENNFLVEFLGPSISRTITDTVSYTSQGYTGLAYALQLPFEWTYGFGNSRTFSIYAERVLDTEILNKTYLARNDYVNNWPNGMFWSSVFPWIASDTTFFGVPIVMFLVGKLIAYSWFDFISKKNVLALIAITQLFIFAFFIPANNQLVQSYQSFFGTMALFSLYTLTKIFRKSNWRN